MTKRNKISYAQTQLPFSGTTTRLIQSPLKREWQALSISGAAVLVVMLVYGYCVVNSIAQVSLKETALTESRALKAELANREGEYLEKTRGITLEYARSLGYTVAKEKVFVTRPGVLSYASDAR